MFSSQNLADRDVMPKKIPPDPATGEDTTNAERAAWAEIGLCAFGKHTGTVGSKVGDDEDPSLIVVDFLADLGHWCDRNDVDLQSALRSATHHYQVETARKGRQLR